MTICDNGDESINSARSPFPTFDISCAGASPGGPGYCFGSDDGRIQFMSMDGCRTIGPFPIAPSKEAVNGITFAGNLMAVSTRSDVTFLKEPEPRRKYFRGPC